MKKTIKTLSTVLTAFLALGSFTNTAKAVTILNSDFEIAGGGGSFPPAASWDGSVRLASHSSYGPGSFSAGNSRFAFTETVAEQTLAFTFQASTTYVFNGYGVQSSDAAVDLSFLIGYDNAGAFVQLGEETYDLNSAEDPITDWTLLDGVSYTTGATGTELGANIIVQVQAKNGSTPNPGGWFDEVALTATVVPEPSSLVLLTFGSLLVAGRRRHA